MRTYKRNLTQQKGASFFGVVVLLLLITIFFTFGLKLGPIYIDHNLVTSVCQDLIDRGQADNMSTGDIRNAVSDSLRINGVRDFDLSSIRVRRENGASMINIAYEKRLELIANLDIVAKFDTTLQ